MANPSGPVLRTWRPQRARNWKPAASPRARLDHATTLTLALCLLASAAAGLAVGWMRGDWRTGLAWAGVGAASTGAGVALGGRVWPALGVRVASLVLGLYARHGRRVNAQLLLTPYPDFVPSRLRQAWESTAFAGALSLAVGVNLLVVLDAPGTMLKWLALASITLCSLGTVLLVPHWTFARLGLRMSWQERFVVGSIAESYAGFVRASNGVMLLGAVFYGATVMAIRLTRLDGYLTVGTTLLLLLLVCAAMMTTATAFFRRREEEVLRAIAAEARRVGFHSVRGGRVASV